MAVTLQDSDFAAVTVRISGAELRLTHNAGADFVWVYALDQVVPRSVGYFHRLGTDDPRRRWWGRIPDWRSNNEIPLRTLFDDVWRFWASRCPDAARQAVTDDVA